MRPTSKGPHGRGPRAHLGGAPSANTGWFRAGLDARRHELTHEERRRGGISRGLQQLQAVHDQVYGTATTEDQAAEVGQLRDVARCVRSGPQNEPAIYSASAAHQAAGGLVADRRRPSCKAAG